MATSKDQPKTKFLTFTETFNVPANTPTTRTYDLGYDFWTHGTAIIKNTSTQAASPANTGRENEGGIFFFTRQDTEATGESQTSYRVQFANTYNEQVIRPTVYNREIDSIVSNRFLGRTNPLRVILITDIFITGSDLSITYFGTSSIGDDVDLSLFVRVFDTEGAASTFSLLMTGDQSSDSGVDADKADYSGSITTTKITTTKPGGISIGGSAIGRGG